MIRQARRADALGLTPGTALSTQPVRVNDLARGFSELARVTESRPAQGDWPLEEEDAEAPDPDRVWFDDLQLQYKAEIDDTWGETESGRSYIAPLAPRLRYVHVDGPVKFYNENGREFHRGENLYLSNRIVSRAGQHVVFAVQPELGFVENRNDPNDDSDLVFRPQEATASLRLSFMDVTVGRQTMWWGPNRHGALLLSNNARPLDAVKVSTPGPVLLPGFLSYLGLVQAEVFATRLEKERAIERPYFAGMRLSTRLNPYVELGASRTAQFGGKGRSVTLRTLWEVFTASTENDEDDPGNQLAALDARFLFPWKVQPFEVYGEYGGEDESGGFFSRVAYTIGVYLPRIGPWHLFEFTGEYTTTTVDGHRRIWYTNENFPDGYTYHEQIMGHHVGTDGLDIYLELRAHPTKTLELWFSYDYEEHFRKDPVEERLHQFRVGLESRVWKKMDVAVVYGQDVWNNFEFDRGRSKIGTTTGLTLSWGF